MGCHNVHSKDSPSHSWILELSPPPTLGPTVYYIEWSHVQYAEVEMEDGSQWLSGSRSYSIKVYQFKLHVVYSMPET